MYIYIEHILYNYIHAIHTYRRTSTYVNMCVYVHINIDIYMYIYIYLMYIYAYTWSYMYARVARTEPPYVSVTVYA